MNIVIVGLGGGGTIVANSIARYMYYRKNNGEQITLTFIDGDEYEQKNNVRQLFRGYGNKAEVKSAELIKDFGDKLNFQIFPEYVNAENINRMIFDGDIVFIAVDNHKSRKVISDHCKTLNNSIIISGGQDDIDGNVQIFVRRDGKNLTSTLDQYHPEIANPDDKSPDELSCEELVETGTPQLFFMNMMIATYMCAAFYNVVEENNLHTEIYIDMLQMQSDSKIRAI